jgi:hypothetical protein
MHLCFLLCQCFVADRLHPLLRPSSFFIRGIFGKHSRKSYNLHISGDHLCYILVLLFLFIFSAFGAAAFRQWKALKGKGGFWEGIEILSYLEWISCCNLELLSPTFLTLGISEKRQGLLSLISDQFAL